MIINFERPRLIETAVTQYLLVIATHYSSSPFAALVLVGNYKIKVALYTSIGILDYHTISK